MAASAQQQATDQVKDFAYKRVTRSLPCHAPEMRLNQDIKASDRAISCGRRITHRQKAAPGVTCSNLVLQQLPWLLEGLLVQHRQFRGLQQADSLVCPPLAPSQHARNMWPTHAAQEQHFHHLS